MDWRLRLPPLKYRSVRVSGGLLHHFATSHQVGLQNGACRLRVSMGRRESCRMRATDDEVKRVWSFVQRKACRSRYLRHSKEDGRGKVNGRETGWIPWPVVGGQSEELTY